MAFPAVCLHLQSTVKAQETQKGVQHRLNMEVDLRSLFGLYVHSSTHWLRPRNPYPPSFGLIYTRVLLVSQDRWHLFVTSWSAGSDLEIHETNELIIS